MWYQGLQLRSDSEQGGQQPRHVLEELHPRRLHGPPPPPAASGDGAPPAALDAVTASRDGPPSRQPRSILPNRLFPSTTRKRLGKPPAFPVRPWIAPRLLPLCRARSASPYSHHSAHPHTRRTRLAGPLPQARRGLGSHSLGICPAGLGSHSLGLGSHSLA